MVEKQKCALCDKEATRFSSPIDNPDEPAFCDEHFQVWLDYIEKKRPEGPKEVPT